MWSAFSQLASLFRAGDRAITLLKSVCDDFVSFWAFNRPIKETGEDPTTSILPDERLEFAMQSTVQKLKNMEISFADELWRPRYSAEKSSLEQNRIPKEREKLPGTRSS